MPSTLETAMESLISTFHAYSGKEGDKYKLSNNELKQLLEGEFSFFLSQTKDQGMVDKIMKDLDLNGDGEVQFEEFVVLISALTVACNDFFVEDLKKKGRI
uniref:protein S100-A1-like n=1 Tax=Myxine glutinosa TaxID=7769 RepID=UPI00358DE88D